jgi:BirA family biotin operon repressor/biotin-[acetyl-CoA-carboxylase] ligase
MHPASAATAAPRVIAYDSVGSTNEEGLILARKGERGPLWITARRQDAGRGRHGRSWTSESGNLYASLLLTDPAPPQRWPELSFVAAVAVYEAVAAVTPAIAANLSLKWPNDLLLGMKKFAGILIEAENSAPAAVVVGIGVNCAHHPADTSYPATDLATAGAAVSPARLFDQLSCAMTARLAQWNRGEGFAQVRADWLSHAAGLGEEICVRLADREIAGRFQMLDDVGRLVLHLPDGTRHAVTAGDVLATGRQ